MVTMTDYWKGDSGCCVFRNEEWITEPERQEHRRQKSGCRRHNSANA